MKKYIYMILSAVVLSLGFTSCIDEEGPGTPSLKKMHLKDTEFTFDLRSDAKGVENGKTCEEKTADFLTESLSLYWIDVTNATYALSFTNALNTDVKEEITNKPVVGDKELNTLFVEISHQQIFDYIEKAEIWQDQFETQKDDKGNDVSVWFQVASVNLNVTGTPIDKTHTALAPEGSTATATITIYRDKQ